LTDAIRIGLAILACYRLCELVAVDSGPYRVFERLRNYMDEIGVVQDTLLYNFAELISCPYCLGVWFAALCYALVYFHLDILLIVGGIAGGQCVLRDLTGGR